MTTLNGLIAETKRYLLGNTREEINSLAAGYTAGGTTVTFTYPMGGIVAGADIEVDLEILRVMSVSGQTATVLGAQNNTTAANHSSGATVRVNPRFERQAIADDLNHALRDLSAEGLYREVALNITFNASVSGYDLTGSSASDVLDILEVRYQQSGPTKRYPVIRSWSLQRGMDTAVFPSGTALTIDSPAFPGLPLRVRYAAQFLPLVNLSDDVTSYSGLAATAADLPPIGAAIRQMMGRDIKRASTDSQPDTRRAQEVPPGVSQGAITTLRREWDQGIHRERGRQLQRFPYRHAL